jgi:hypothetical protein
MELRAVKYSDYEQLKGWWDYWKFPAPAISALPKYDDEITTGLMVYNGGLNICAGFLYETNSALCWVEFIVANPESKKEERSEALSLLINEFTDEAKKLGFGAIFASIKHPSLLNKYIEAGYTLGTTNTNELIKIL